MKAEDGDTWQGTEIWRSNILVYKSQQDAQVTEFILSGSCSTCFGFHYHPSSGAQNNCNYSDSELRNM